MAQSFMRRLAAKAGSRLQRLGGVNPNRESLVGSLEVAKRAGFYPTTVIDIGASRGSWTRQAAGVFETARFVLLDPLAENEDGLRATCCALEHAAYVLAAAGDHVGTVDINVHSDLDGSSLLLEREEGIDGEPRPVAATTVDDVVSTLELKGPFLMKADTQGSEMLVLRGSADAIHDTEMIVLEVLLFDVFQGEAPEFEEVVSYLKQKDFVLWDLFGLEYRPLDGALCQVDAVFVREASVLRRFHQYATGEQRAAQLAKLGASKAGRQRLRRSE